MGQQRKRHNRRHRGVTRPAVLKPGAITPVLPDPIAATASTVTASIESSPPDPQASAIARGSSTLVHRELLKVVVVLVIVSAALVGLLVTNQETGWLSRIADSLYRWLRLG